LRYYASKYAGEERHDEKLCRCCIRAWLGPHLGHDPEATRQVKQAVTALVRAVFKLN